MKKKDDLCNNRKSVATLAKGGHMQSEKVGNTQDRDQSKEKHRQEKK